MSHRAHRKVEDLADPHSSEGIYDSKKFGANLAVFYLSISGVRGLELSRAGRLSRLYLILKSSGNSCIPTL